MTITPEIIKQVQGYGFDVYMRNPKDTYMLFTDGKNIGYLQAERGGGITLCTVHKPNRQTGTGFQVQRYGERMDKRILEQCFAHSPSWASSTDRESVKKFRDIEDYRSRDSFNAGYKLVTPEGNDG